MRQTEGLYRSFRLLVELMIGAGALVIGLGIVGYLFFMRMVDVPAVRQIAERELATGTLRFGERVERAAHVYIRRPSDYFRGANGVLAATDERLIFIGVAPQENLEASDAPPVIIEQEFVNDTLLSIEKTRIFFGTAKGVIARRRGEEARYAATRRHLHELEALAEHVNRLHAVQRLAGARESRIREGVRRTVEAPLYYTVRRGDAISTIANKFGTTVEDIQRWNRLPGPRIRAGDKLLVKPPGAAK